jgi:transcriptional regulator with XRE-family HTH domain
MDFSNIDREQLSKLINTRRVEREMSLSQLARHLEVSTKSAMLVLRGSRLPSPPLLERLLEVLEIPESEIPRLQALPHRPAGKYVFVSYSHRDSAYLERLMVHLKPLQKQGVIDPWVDTRLQAGDKWKKEIEKALQRARVAVLLVSADFLASDFIVENELPPLLQAAEAKGTLIIPVILKPCRFTRDKNLQEFQAINSPDEPLSLADENERELVYDTIAQRIEDLLVN